MSLAARFFLIALLLPCVNAWALTPLRGVELTTDVTVDLSGTVVDPYFIVLDQSPFGGIDWIFTGELTGAARPTAYNRRFNDEFLFAFDATVLDPPNSFVGHPGDVWRYDPSGGAGFGYTLRFSAQGYGIPAGVLTDAITDYGNDLLLSFDTTVSLPAAGGGTITAGKEDLVRLISGTGTFATLFDGSSLGIPAGMNLDGAHYMFLNGHRIFISFDGSGSIGGVEFDKEDVIEYDAASDSYFLAYDGDALHAGWPPANLIGLAVQVANLTVGGSRIVGHPGGSACLNPFLLADGAQVGHMGITLTSISGKLTDIAACRVHPSLPGAGYTSTVNPSNVGAAIYSSGSLVPNGISIACQVRLGTGLMPGTYSLAATGVASNPDFSAYSPVSSIPATLVVTNCHGDCDGNGAVSIGEMQRAINLHLGAPLCQPDGIVNMKCAVSDANGDRNVDIGEVQQAVNRMLGGCPADSAAKRVFITSTTHTGNLGGLAGADAICAARAAAVNLTGTYKAWLSSESVSAASRLVHWNGPYTQIDGTLIAYGWDDLTDNSLQEPISLTETLGTGSSFWTGTLENGTINTGGTCSSWASSAAQGGGGSTGYTTGWSSNFGSVCSIAHALLCIQQ